MKKVKNTLPWTCVISDQHGEEILGTFYNKELRKTNEKVFRVKTVTKRKDGRLYTSNGRIMIIHSVGGLL